MADITSSHTMLTLDTETEDVIEQMLAEIQQLNLQIQQDQVVIDRLKAESKIITDHTDAILSSLRAQIEALGRPG